MSKIFILIYTLTINNTYNNKMTKTLSEKILSAHLVDGKIEKGKKLG